ncbi:MAG: NAD(P)H-dependent oxidoreductase [Chloroflexota bacterium]
MTKILIVFSHSDFAQSRINKAMLEAIDELENVTIHILEESAPNFKFDVEKEQALLVQFDVIVLQFPMYWFGSPALLKHWIDEVFLYGFAYGSTGNSLKDKTLVCATTAGGEAVDFTPDGAYGYSVKEFYRPFEITAKFCKMGYAEPFSIYDSANVTDDELVTFAADYRRWLANI